MSQPEPRRRFSRALPPAAVFELARAIAGLIADRRRERPPPGLGS